MHQLLQESGKTAEKIIHRRLRISRAIKLNILSVLSCTPFRSIVIYIPEYEKCSEFFHIIYGATNFNLNNGLIIIIKNIRMIMKQTEANETNTNNTA